MNRLNFSHFLSIGRRLLSTGLCLAALMAREAHAQDATTVVNTQPRHTQSTREAHPTPEPIIQEIQRLLKLLATNYPDRFRSVDPGQLDGVLNNQTVSAIHNFRKIAGLKTTNQSKAGLKDDILSEFAAMSAQSSPDILTPGAAGCDKKTSVPECPSPPPAPSVAIPPAALASQDQKIRNKTAKVETDAGTKAAGPQTKSSEEPAGPDKASAGIAVPGADKGKNPPVTVFFVQVASLQSLDAAKREWQRIFAKNRVALTGEQVYFQEAAIAGRGTFYRVLVGPTEERNAAKTLCNILKQNDQSCVVTQRGLSDLQKPTIKAPTSTAAASAGNEQQGVSQAMPRETATDVKETAGFEPPARTPAAGAKIAEVMPEPAPPADPKPPTAAAPTNRMPPVQTPAEPAVRTPANMVTPAPRDTVSSGGRIEDNATLPAKRNNGADTALPAGETAAPSSAAPKSGGSAVPVPPKPADEPPARQNRAALRMPQPAPQTNYGVHQEITRPGSATPDDQTTTQPVPQPGAVTDLLRFTPGMNLTLGMLVVLILGAASLLLIWRRQERRAALSQIVEPAVFSFLQPSGDAAQPADMASRLEQDYESGPLHQSRIDRDEFLRNILGDDVEADGAAPKEDSAIRINASLKELLVSDPNLYKSIFLNFIFLAKVGAALNRNEITIDALNGHLGREFDLLQTYFKIHLLELDDRHQIRKELPGLFYCLQLAQQRQRPTGPSGRFATH